MGRKKSSTDWQQNDPGFAAEQRKHAHPAPSRQFIIQSLNDGGPMRFEALADHIGIDRETEGEGLRHRLDAMVRDGQLLRNRRGAYGPAKRMNLIPGRVSGHRDGFGFLIPDDASGDLFLPPREMESLMSGDHVLVRPVPGRGGKREAVLVEVLERAHTSLTGRFVTEYGVHRVIAANPNIVKDVLIPPQDVNGARDGQMVVAEIVSPPARRALAVGRVSEVLGDHLAPGMEIETAIRAFGLPHAWPEAVEREVADIPSSVPASQKQGREDIRDLPLVTIDGSDARDFDDAVYCERDGKGWRLLVAIADVSSYVTPDSALDREAALRGNSVYFPDHVLPMLPEVLSNGLCSLNPKVDRLCMVCDMKVNSTGTVTGSRFYDAVMRSHARLIYDDVAAALGGSDADAPKALRPRMPQLRELHSVYQALMKQRSRRGAIELDSQETRIVFGKDRKIERLVPVVRNEAHRIIEECMIAANVQAARFVQKAKLPNLYRVHERPPAEKITAMREFLAVHGISLPGGDAPEPGDLARAAEEARRKDVGPGVQMAVLRTMMQARYSAEPDGHFGLALEHYAHFTSPIRRYPDLLLHRAIRHAIKRQPRADFEYSEERVQAVGDHCSMTERRADEATRDVVSWLKCEYMKEHEGECFDGVITGVAGFGVFVTLQDYHVEGMVHVSALLNDYYEYDEMHQRLVGARNGRRFGIGDRLRVRITRVSLDQRRIDMEPATDGEADGDGVQQAFRADVKKSGRKRGKASGGRKPGGTDRAPKRKKKRSGR